MEQLNNMTIGKKIMSLRKEAGLTQEQLAEKLGISPQAVSKWENGISCPDISILPTLASLFHVTVDDLLGVERPAEPMQFEEPQPQEAPPEQADSVYYGPFGCCGGDNGRRGKWHGLGFALLLIGLGVVFLLCRHFGLTPSVWDIVWPAAVIGLGVAWFVGEIAPIGLGVAFIGFYYLLRNVGQPLPFILDWDLIWPAGLVLLGLGVLIDCFRWGNRWHERWLQRHRCGEEAMEYSESDEGFLYVRAVFGQGNRRVRMEKLTGGKVDYVFAGGELDLTGVKALGDNAAAALQVHVVFAGCSIFLPPHIRVENKANCVFGGVEIKGGPANPTSVLTLTGDVVFGGIEIRYIG
ncbi:MAG: helix-turn-helix domain-containing protein [Candidatus Pelethousia sp.]|nr:helix-turn-helix domain-containing protein [Candidatus Pelethousia sp.]